MTGMEAAIAMQVAGALISARGQMQQGNDAATAAQYNANVLNQAAGQDRARSQRAAEEERRKSSIRQSTAVANAAASGASASDPTAVKVVSDLAGYGEYEALTKLYEGEESARGNESKATMSVWEGKRKKEAAYAGAFSTLVAAGGKAASASMGGGSSLFSKYNSDTPWLTDGSTPNPVVYQETPWIYG